MTDASTARCIAAFEEAAESHQRAGAVLAPLVVKAAQLLQERLAAGSKVLVCGNGGSAAESQHFAAELTGRFRRERRALPGIALSVDTSALTAIGNDYGFERVFARQVEALGQRGDVLVAISTSGNSPNVVAAAEVARAQGVSVIALTGPDSAALGRTADIALAVPAPNTARVQEVHLTLLHSLCEELDRLPSSPHEG